MSSKKEANARAKAQLLAFILWLRRFKLKQRFIVPISVLYDIVIQITLRSNHHYAKLNDINKVCQQKFGHALFSYTIPILAGVGVCVVHEYEHVPSTTIENYVSVCRSVCHFQLPTSFSVLHYRYI